MKANENDFFRQATMHICGSLDIATALHRTFVYLRDRVPADVLTLYLFKENLGYRIIATATPEGGRKSDTILPLSSQICEMVKKKNLPHTVIERAGFKPAVVRIVNRPESDYVLNSFTPYFGTPDYSSLVMYLTVEEERLGTLGLRVKGKDRYSEKDARLMALLAEPFAIALSNWLRYEETLQLKDLIADDNRYLRRELFRISGDQIIGGDSGLRGVMDMVRQVSAMDSPVLLRGETGVGKDVIANAIHYSSTRRNGPFIKVNCGAIPDTLLDSELFGHEKGAFTGAITQKRGFFERANHGTIFLDEIGELPMAAQVRLLRVLQYKEIKRLGGSMQTTVDIRVIAATHRNLEEMVSRGQFREDLWFRLNVFPIFIPPLRERKSDIPVLVHHLISRKAKDLKLTKIPHLTPGIIDRFVAYHWPGNIRELENMIERALILNQSDVLGAAAFLIPSSTPNVRDRDNEDLLPLDDAITTHIRRALDATNGRINGPNGAAQLLCVNPNTLRNRMNKLGIEYGRVRKQG
ncbi:MAG: Formate hydrogenlyase transcriptional activator [Syntrophaceae bacterium PtaU1.Bin231]|nr:MAG: Formate hydrogenlyase transcriptional activator [Syntrophaceae bacterium PtaU1.Bin231]